MAINPLGIDPSLLGDQWNTGFLQNMGKPTFMQPSPGVPYRTPTFTGTETILPQPTLADLGPKTSFIPSPQESFNNFYSITGAPGAQPIQSKSPSSSNQLTDILNALAQSIQANFNKSSTATTTTQTSGPAIGDIKTSSPSLTTTTNPNIGLK